MDKLSRGFSVIEIVIAMAIATIVISGMVISAGGFASAQRGQQSTIMNGQSNAEAVTQAQKLLEYMQSLGRQDFNLVNPIATTTSDRLYYGAVDVTLQPDLLTKLVTATVSWRTDHNSTSSVKLSTLVTNLDNVNSPAACNSTLSGDWSNAQITAPFDVGPSSSSGNPVTEIAVFNKKLFITTSNTHGHNDDFYIYDYSANPLNPVFVSSLDTNGLTPGDNSVAVASSSAHTYAYVANGNSPNWSTCTAGANCSQLQVIDATNAAAPTIAKNYKVPGITGTGGQSVPNVVVYKNGYIYMGTTKAKSGEPEFLIIDVGGGGGGASPTNPILKGSYVVGAGVANIYVKGSYAFLAVSDNAREMIILNVSNPASPSLESNYNATGGSSSFGYGNAVTGVGSKVYLGRNYIAGAPEFIALDTTNTAAVTTLGTYDPGVSPNTESVNGIVVRDYLAFVVMTDFFQIWNIANPAAISLVKSFDLGGNGANGIASGCDANYMFVGSYRTNNDKGVFYVVYTP